MCVKDKHCIIVIHSNPVPRRKKQTNKQANMKYIIYFVPSFYNIIHNYEGFRTYNIVGKYPVFIGQQIISSNMLNIF